MSYQRTWSISMAETSENGSPPRYGRRRSFLPLSPEPFRPSPLSPHGGALNSLISEAAIDASSIRSSSPYRADSIHNENFDTSDWGRSSHRRRSTLLNTPQMRSQRLIGNSNPRYRWERYWQTEEQLKSLKRPM